MTKEELIQEEQEILDALILKMDNAVLKLNRQMTREELTRKKSIGIKDAYGQLLAADKAKEHISELLEQYHLSRDALYSARIQLSTRDDRGTREQEIKIGLHTFAAVGNLFIVKWTMPLCRHFMLNTGTEFETTIEQYGRKITTYHTLKMKRTVDLFFDKVQDVMQDYPSLSLEAAEEVVADSFLKELLSRRADKEFRNIVFTIQRHQGEIIQLPFRQNLIVQGCAGSGKSMIMLHRLPILLADNPNNLARNRIYIASPSEMYNQLARSMCYELEIQDLNMGTLDSYYRYVINKYNRSSRQLGKKRDYHDMEPEKERYIYSSECVEEIKAEIAKAIAVDESAWQEGLHFFNLHAETEASNAEIPNRVLRQKLIRLQTIVQKNEEAMRLHIRAIRTLQEEGAKLSQRLTGRRTEVENGIRRKLASEIKERTEQRKNLEELSGKVQEEAEDQRSLLVQLDNCTTMINASTRRIKRYQELLGDKEAITAYSSALMPYYEELGELLDMSKEAADQELTINRIYSFLENWETRMARLDVLLEAISNTETTYDSYAGSLAFVVQSMQQAIDEVQKLTDTCLPQQYYLTLKAQAAELERIANALPDIIYSEILEEIGQKADRSGVYADISCSSYLYLQILYQYCGVPNEAGEDLITIDEAQNVEVEEYRLISAVNRKKVTLNLFGDVNQHIEGTKGIDKWSEVPHYPSFNVQELSENYRNARQITEYCNERFGMMMKAINLDGAGVHQCRQSESAEGYIRNLLGKPLGNGLSCIIVKDTEEAGSICAIAGDYANRVLDLTEKPGELLSLKWNLITVAQTKGLEFETVLAVSGRMTENEKYITYTRALDGLYVLDDPITIREKPNTEDIKNEPAAGTRKREKRNRG